MGITSILLVSLIIGGERILIRGDPTLGESGNDCCLSIAVSVGGSYANFTGDYQYKRKEGDKPEEVCVNGCVYTKDGLPSTVEFCFKGKSVAGANVQCQVRKDLICVQDLFNI